MITEFQQSEIQERNKNKKELFRKNRKQAIDAWIPGFVGEQAALQILCDVFKVRQIKYAFGKLCYENTSGAIIRMEFILIILREQYITG